MTEYKDMTFQQQIEYCHQRRLKMDESWQEVEKLRYESDIHSAGLKFKGLAYEGYSRCVDPIMPSVRNKSSIDYLFLLPLLIYFQVNNPFLKMLLRAAGLTDLTRALQKAESEEDPLQLISIAYNFFSRSKGEDKSKTIALFLYEKAANKGLAAAQFSLGIILLFDANSTPHNKKQGIKWLHKAADQAYSPAQHCLSKCYRYGEGVKRDISKAYQFWKLAMIQGEQDVPFSYYGALPYIEDLEQALNQFRDKQKQDEVQALIYLSYTLNTQVDYFIHTALPGNAHRNQIDDYNNAWAILIEYYDSYLQRDGEEESISLQSAKVFPQDKGRPNDPLSTLRQIPAMALFVAGKVSLNVKDFRQAENLFFRLASQGSAYAQYMLYLCCSNPENPQKDASQGFSWLHTSAENNCAEAQYALSQHYSQWDSSPENLLKARLLLRAAAMQGFPQACYQIGVALIKGSGNEVEALPFFMRIKERSHAEKTKRHLYRLTGNLIKEELWEILALLEKAQIITKDSFSSLSPEELSSEQNCRLEQSCRLFFHYLTQPEINKAELAKIVPRLPLACLTPFINIGLAGKPFAEKISLLLYCLELIKDSSLENKQKYVMAYVMTEMRSSGKGGKRSIMKVLNPENRASEELACFLSRQESSSVSAFWSLWSAPPRTQYWTSLIEQAREVFFQPLEGSVLLSG